MCSLLSLTAKKRRTQSLTAKTQRERKGSGFRHCEEERRGNLSSYFNHRDTEKHRGFHYSAIVDSWF